MKLVALTAITASVLLAGSATPYPEPQVEMAPTPGTHRIQNVHRNVPGVLRDVNRIVSDLNANIHAQMLATDANIGYLVMDLDQDVSDQVKAAVAALDTNIRTRILY